jgi:hypothetical protein
MRVATLIVLAAMAAASLALPGLDAAAGSRGPHPVIGWGGNRFLFEVEPEGTITRLTAYRAAGAMWQLVGTTTIRKGQKAPERGFLQKIWFKGPRLGVLEADMDNPYWRYYPGEDRGGSFRFDN